jgi:hypothetical protein
MLTLDEILAMWNVDSKIDETNLDTTCIKGAVLHAKYLEYYSLSKLQYKKTDLTLANLKKDKWMYYNGKMTKEEMDLKSWPYNPFGAMAKPLKSEMDMFYDTDPDIVKVKLRLDYLQTLTECLKDILDTIKWRHQTIKNIIDHRRFVSGS